MILLSLPPTRHTDSVKYNFNLISTISITKIYQLQERLVEDITGANQLNQLLPYRKIRIANMKTSNIKVRSKAIKGSG